MTVTAPATRPATAPAPDMRIHISDKTIMGPNAAPKPAQAWLTSSSTWEVGSRAMNAATRPTATTLMRPTRTHCFSVAFLFRNRWYMSSVSDDDETSSWLEMVL